MSNHPKYQAKPVFWDSGLRKVLSLTAISKYYSNGRLKLPEYIWRFDSQHEFKVYLELVRMYGADRIERQFPVPIFYPSKCYSKGKTWKVDFVVSLPDSMYHYDYLVEAKGAFLTEFAVILAVLETIDEVAFNALRIVFPSKIPERNQMVKALLKTDYARNLLTLNQLKKLKGLP